MEGTVAVRQPRRVLTEGCGLLDAVGRRRPNDAPAPITTREALKAYDPGLFDLVETTMAYKGKVDWRYLP